MWTHINSPNSPIAVTVRGRGTAYPSWVLLLFFPVIIFFLLFLSPRKASAEGELLVLQDLINDALKNNHEILSAEARMSASEFKIPQAKSLPDPMFMFGYQNEGFKKYTYGKSEDAQWMFSASQTFPYPGKLSLKGEMAAKEAEGQAAVHESAKLQTIARIKELYYDLLLLHKNLDLIKDRTALFSRIEDAALARYSSGMGPQQEVIMAQTEKYMLLEKEEMLKQKRQSIESMLNSVVGRDINSPLGRPAEISNASYPFNRDELIRRAYENSPEVRSKQKMVAAAETKVNMAEKEYFPDFTVNAGYFNRGGEFESMWSLTTTINIPLYYKTKQRQAVNEAKVYLDEAHHELEGTKLMIASGIRDNYSMIEAAGRLMDLYKNGLIPRTSQDFELALSGYMAGKTEALTVISRLKSLLDFESLYWGQLVEKEKAIARIEALTGLPATGAEVNKR